MVFFRLLRCTWRATVQTPLLSWWNCDKQIVIIHSCGFVQRCIAIQFIFIYFFCPPFVSLFSFLYSLHRCVCYQVVGADGGLLFLSRCVILVVLPFHLNLSTYSLYRLGYTTSSLHKFRINQFDSHCLLLIIISDSLAGRKFNGRMFDQILLQTKQMKHTTAKGRDNYNHKMHTIKSTQRKCNNKWTELNWAEQDEREKNALSPFFLVSLLNFVHRLYALRTKNGFRLNRPWSKKVSWSNNLIVCVSVCFSASHKMPSHSTDVRT